MTCAEIKDRTIDFLYGELPQGERAAFEQHLAGCDACRGEVLGLQGTLHQARAAVKLTDEAPPPRVRVAVLEAARAAAGPAIQMAARAAPVRKPIEQKAEGGGLWDWLRRPWLIPLAAAAAVVTIFVVGKEELTKTTPYEVVRPERAAEAPKAEPAPVVTTPSPSMPATPPPVADEVPAASAKPAARPPSPARKAAERRLGAVANKMDGLQNARDKDRAYAPPPPPRPAARRDQAPQEEAAESDTLEGALSGPVGGLEERKGAAAGGAGSGYLGGRKSETTADQKQVQVQRGPAPRELAKQAPAPVRAQAPAATATAAPPPAAPSAPRQAPAAEKESSRGRAAEPAAAPMDDVMEREAPAKAKAKKTAGEAQQQQLSVQEKIDKANRLFMANRWAEAAAAYRELLRLYPDHKSANVWKARLRTSEQSQQSQSR